MYAAYKYGLSERGLANEILGIPISNEDMSNPDDEGQAPRIPIVLQDGDLDPNVEPAVEPQIDRQDHSTLVFHEDPEEERQQRQEELDRQAAEEAKAEEEAIAAANLIRQAKWEERARLQREHNQAETDAAAQAKEK